MKGKLVASVALGAIAGYAVSKMRDKGFVDGMRDKLNDFSAKTKRDVKNAMDRGANEVEYAKDRVKGKAMEMQGKMG